MKSIGRKIVLVVVCFFQLLTANAVNYYWVNGTGNWSNYALHWATTSGGNVFHTKVPTSLDNVYFDANSFTASVQSVTLDTTIVYCKDMDWTGAVSNSYFQAANTSIELKVFGSLTLNAAMNFTFNGKLTFTALAAGKTISTFGKSLSCEIEFNGAGGEWTMMDSLTTHEQITLTYGTLRTNDNNLRCRNFYSDNTNTRALYLGTSNIALSYGWSVNSSLVIDADSSVIKFVIAHAGGFFAEGQIYNIIENGSVNGDSLKIHKIINDNSRLNTNLRFSQVDTIVTQGSYSSTGDHNKINYLSVNSNFDLSPYYVVSNGDSINTLIVGGNATFGFPDENNNYVRNFTIHGNLVIPETYASSFQTIDTCTIYGNGSFLSDGNDLGILTVKQGKTFTFGANKTQTIDSLIPLSTPGFPIQLVSSDLGLIAHVRINSPLCADYLYIHSINAIGSDLYAGANSDNVANNFGWIFAPCTPTGCSAFFDLFPDTVPHQYFAVNLASGTAPLSYIWSWGDGTTDTIPYPSHIYSDTGTYTICLSITDATGCMDTFCNSYYLQKRGSPMVSVNVVASIPTGIEQIPSLEGMESVSLYPNPTSGTITLKGMPSRELGMASLSLKLFDALGRQMWQQSPASVQLKQGLTIDLKDESEGIYFLNIRTASGSRVMKVVKY